MNERNKGRGRKNVKTNKFEIFKEMMKRKERDSKRQRKGPSCQPLSHF